MKRTAVILLIALLSCKSEPEPIRFGTDACHHCKMTLMDRKFGAEVVTAKGKVYKFDDLDCMARFITSGYLKGETISHTLAIDYSNPEKFISAEAAFYLQSDNIRSPMGSGIAAFGSEAERQKFQTELNGKARTWSEISTPAK